MAHDYRSNWRLSWGSSDPHVFGARPRPAWDASVKIRRAQAELGEWHESLNRWHLQFENNPYARIDTTRDDSDDLLNSINWKLDQPRNYPLTILTNRCEIIMPLSGSTTTNITFRSFLTTAISTVDPWGSPTSTCHPTTPSLHAFSLRPGSQIRRHPTGAASTPDPTLDDIYFER